MAQDISEIAEAAPASPIFLTTDDVAQRLFGQQTRHHRQLVLELIDKGEIVATRVRTGGRFYITQDALAAYVERVSRQGDVA